MSTAGQVPDPDRAAAAPTFDVVGVGVAAVDDILWVEQYPAADAKVRVLRRERHPGGLTATALVAAARLGVRCAYAGALGDDEDSHWIVERLGAEGIETGFVTRLPGAGPVRSVIVVGTGLQTRNVFSDASRVVDLPDEAAPAPAGLDSVVARARVLLVDHVYPELAIRAASTARARGGAVVADLEKDHSPRLGDLVHLVDHLVLGRAFAARLTGEAEPGRAAVALYSPGRTAVVTCGAEGCWYASDETGGLDRHLPAFAVEAVDTTGCGDVFHGAYAAALAEGQPLVERLRVASAAAALKARGPGGGPGGQAGIPDQQAVTRFLAERSA
jgi:sugar/nucleoside kinase (ribokinase family)